MKEIPVGEHVVKVDEDIAALVERTGVAVLRDHSGRLRPCVRMKGLSSVVMPAKRGYVTDHINSDPLDNRRENLQVIPVAMNNMKKRTTATPGVTFHKVSGRYRAALDGRRTGCFRSLLDAQLAADAHRRSLGIKGMPLNFPEVGEYGHDGTQRVS
jgi:hypothetical protein